MDGQDQPPQAARVTHVDAQTRALATWPRLDRRKLSRTHGDLTRIVGRRTALPLETIIGMLERGS